MIKEEKKTGYKRPTITELKKRIIELNAVANDYKRWFDYWKEEANRILKSKQEVCSELEELRKRYDDSRIAYRLDLENENKRLREVAMSLEITRKDYANALANIKQLQTVCEAQESWREDFIKMCKLPLFKSIHKYLSVRKVMRKGKIIKGMYQL